MVFIGLIEEAAKLIVPVALYLLWRPRDARGGVLIGIASGMGFATLETMGYGFQALLSGGIAAVDQTLLLRALFVPAGHIAWTGRTSRSLEKSVAPQPQSGLAQIDQLPHEFQQVRVALRKRPIHPTDFVVLAVGVVVAGLSPAKLVPGLQQGYALR